MKLQLFIVPDYTVSTVILYFLKFKPSHITELHYKYLLFHLFKGCVSNNIILHFGYSFHRTFIEILIAVFNGYSPFSAENAVDGKIVSGAISGSCAQTVNEEDPWWQVQLDNSYPVTFITITTPESCKTCRECYIICIIC
jgi:hypothetical protein